MEVKGLYRVSGNRADIEAVQQKFEEGKRIYEKYDTRWSRVAWLLFFTRCDVFCDLLQYTHTRENVIYLFYTIRIQMVYWRILGHEKEKQVCWRDMAWIWRHLCVSLQ